ncbi:hypothetical protein C8Q75DRAFT_711126 [Abortiporus biennis]|nr:hypothetical protein C8Q75DRAFT_711126 [Abortiporus biennis]
MTSPLPPLPNPLTSLAWLPPDIANQLEASRYLYSATIGAWIWDFLMSLHEEYVLFSRSKVRIPAVVYLLARMASFAFILTALIFQVGSVDDCHALAKAIGWFGGIAMPLNSLLFFFRVKAVFNHSRVMVTLFGLLWLATLGCISAPFAVDGIHIGTTRNCVNSSVKSYSSAGIIIVAVHDTLVFFAITFRLTSYSLADTWPEQVKTFFSGRGMGKMSKTLLHTGQLYYLATVGFNIVAAVIILAPSVPPVLRAMFSIPNVALQNAMACRVYRQLKLGIIQDLHSPFSASASGSGSTPIRFMPTFRSQTSKTFIGTQSQFEYQFNKEFKMQVGINKETEVVVDQLTSVQDPESLEDKRRGRDIIPSLDSSVE